MAEKLSIRSVVLDVLLVLGKECFLIFLICRIDLGLYLVSKYLAVRYLFEDIRMTESYVCEKCCIELCNVFSCKEVELVRSSTVQKDYFCSHRKRRESLLLQYFIKNDTSLDLELGILIKIRTEL